jgi:hypothetical protein
MTGGVYIDIRARPLARNESPVSVGSIVLAVGVDVAGVVAAAVVVGVLDDSSSIFNKSNLRAFSGSGRTDSGR